MRYTGVVYGLDPLDLMPSKAAKPQQPGPQSREEILEDRVMKTPQLAERAATIADSAEDIRGITMTLKRNREKFVNKRNDFESELERLETETIRTAQRDLQVTLEVAAPKQAKEILRSMLASDPADPADDVMKDVVGIVKLLPVNKLKKILAEFKTDEERKVLHKILVEIGELDERGTQLTRSEP